MLIFAVRNYNMKISTETTITFTKSDIDDLVKKKIEEEMGTKDKITYYIEYIIPMDYDRSIEGEPYFDSIVVKPKLDKT